jgi:hypothetical protein
VNKSLFAKSFRGSMANDPLDAAIPASRRRTRAVIALAGADLPPGYQAGRYF